jgi:hypothetical protein
MIDVQPSGLLWTDIIDESVHTSDDIDIGDIEAVSKDFIVVKRGFINIHYYYVPIKYVEGWDGSVLWLKITENKVKEKYEKNEIPDPYMYFVKDYPYYSTSLYPTLAVLPARYRRPVYDKGASPDNRYLCPLCNEKFNEESNLSDHVESVH